MRTLAVMSQKGGAGKSTATVHAAVAAMLAGSRVVVFDTDPQQSAYSWARNRGFADPLVLAVTVPKLAQALDAARADGFDLAIIDTQPRAGPDSVDVARLADRVLIPIRPSAFDFAAVADTLRIVDRARVDVLLALSACKSRTMTEQARQALATTGKRVAETTIGDRVAYVRALETGRAAVEFEPNGKAAHEMNALLAEVLQ